MNLEAVIALASLCATVTLTVAGGAVRICAKLEKVSSALATLVTKEECAERRKRCTFRHRVRSERKGGNHG